jgi:hypothetical protein
MAVSRVLVPSKWDTVYSFENVGQYSSCKLFTEFNVRQTERQADRQAGTEKRCNTWPYKYADTP